MYHLLTELIQINDSRPIHEGHIKVVDRLRTDIRDFVLASTAQRIIDAVIELGNQQAVDLTEQAINNTYPRIKPTKRASKTFKRPTKQELPTDYQQFYDLASKHWDDVGELKVRCYFTSASFGGSEDGAYYPNENLIKINCSFVEDLNYQQLVQLVEEDKLNRAQSLMRVWTGKMMDPVAIAYHELVHYMQYSVLAHGHPQQIKQADDLTDFKRYRTSILEIPAQVEGFAVNTKLWVLKYKSHFPNLSFKTYARYVIGDLPLNQFVDQTGVDAKYVPKLKNGGAMSFFHDLKNMRPSLYQKAVKLFMQKVTGQ